MYLEHELFYYVSLYKWCDTWKIRFFITCIITCDIASSGSRFWTLRVRELNTSLLDRNKARGMQKKKFHFIYLVGLLCTCQQISHTLKQSNEWYVENLSSVINATCKNIHYIKYLVSTKGTVPNIRRVFRRPLHVYFSDSGGPRQPWYLLPSALRCTTCVPSRHWKISCIFIF